MVECPDRADLGKHSPDDKIQVQSKDNDDQKLIVDVELSWTSNVSVDILIGEIFIHSEGFSKSQLIQCESPGQTGSH